MNRYAIKKTKEGLSCLNIGCGGSFHKEWNNLDLFKNEWVNYYDARKPLPYLENSFDCAYSSHMLEHLSREKAILHIRDIAKVIKKDGVIRIAVPDLEKICEEYLKYLKLSINEPTPVNLQRYQWIVLELLDQMTREKSGGYMREVLDSGKTDVEYLKERIGDRAGANSKKRDNQKSNNIIVLLKKLKNSFCTFRQKFYDPRKMGEVHKWMYDRLSLKLLLEEMGFANFSVKKFNESNIKHWDKYNLDASSSDPNRPRKPDSIYVEAIKK